MLGMTFGAARGIRIVAMLVLFAGLTPMPQEAWWQQSQLVGYFTDIALWIRDVMPEDIAGKFSF